MEKELRNYGEALQSQSEENRHIEGYALVFNSESRDLGGFTESIDSHALDGVIEQSDVMCLLDHNPGKGVLARCKYGVGSLTLSIDERGLKYSFDAPHTALGEEVLEGVRRGDITTSSFAFVVADDHWDKRDDGTYHRTILKVDKLYDVSPVYQEAYQDTSVALRSIKELDTEELKAYYQNLKSQL